MSKAFFDPQELDTTQRYMVAVGYNSTSRTNPPCVLAASGQQAEYELYEGMAEQGIGWDDVFYDDKDYPQEEGIYVWQGTINYTSPSRFGEQPDDDGGELMMRGTWRKATSEELHHLQQGTLSATEGWERKTPYGKEYDTATASLLIYSGIDCDPRCDLAEEQVEKLNELTRKMVEEGPLPSPLPYHGHGGVCANWIFDGTHVHLIARNGRVEFYDGKDNTIVFADTQGIEGYLRMCLAKQIAEHAQGILRHRDGTLFASGPSLGVGIDLSGGFTPWELPKDA